MEDPATKKLIEEIESIRFERRASQIRLWLDAIKSGTILVGAIVVFWAIQRPDSVLRQTSSMEEIARERARLLLEWQKEPDPGKRQRAFTIIRATFKTQDEEWLREIDAAMAAEAKAQFVTLTILRLDSLSTVRDSIQTAARGESDGTRGTGMPGRGEVYTSRVYQLEAVDAQMASLRSALQESGFDLQKLPASDTLVNR